MIITLSSLVVVAFLVWIVWCAFTWYWADDQPVFAPFKQGRVTFLEVVQASLRNIAKITRPAWLWVWLNAPFTAVIAVDAVSLMDEALRHAIYTHPLGALAMIALNLIARYGSTAAHAPMNRA